MFREKRPPKNLEPKYFSSQHPRSYSSQAVLKCFGLPDDQGRHGHATATLHNQPALQGEKRKERGEEIHLQQQQQLTIL